MIDDGCYTAIRADPTAPVNVSLRRCRLTRTVTMSLKHKASCRKSGQQRSTTDSSMLSKAFFLGQSSSGIPKRKLVLAGSSSIHSGVCVY